jgi:hypothetical protein
LKVKTDIINGIACAASQIGRAVILVIMYVKSLPVKPNIIVFIGKVIMFDVTLTDNFQYHNHFVDTDNIAQ